MRMSFKAVMNRYVCAFALFSAMAMLLTLNLRPAFSQAGTATILGTVTDSSGAAIPNASVAVMSTDTGFMQTVTSDAQGRFNVPQLPIGQYSVTISAPGFQTEVRSGITLTVGAQTAVNATMKVGQAQQTVTVQGQVTQVENTQTSLDTLVEPTQMRELPLNGRDFEQLLTLAPGVVKQAGGAGFYGTQENYSVSGSRPEGQAFLLDNTNVQDFWMHGTGSGALGTSLGIDAIAEFQMLTNTYSAQYGGNGAVVNAVTRSGTNSFHGSAYEFIRNSALDSRNYFDPVNTIPPFRRNQFGGTLGGPIKKDKLFFFANYEGVRQLFGQSFIANVPDAASRSGPVAPSIASTLALYPLATREIGNGIGQVTTQGNQVGSENYGITRVDYNFSDKDSAFARYGVDQAQIVIPNGGSNILLWPETLTTFNQYLTLQERHTISANLINLARVSYVRTNEIQKTTGSTPPLQFFNTSPENGEVTVTGLNAIGANQLLPSTEIQNRFTYGDDVVWTHGAHNFTFGMAVERTQDNTSAPLFIGGVFTFNSLGNFLAGKPTLIQAPVPGQNDAAGYLREMFFTPYFEDSWKVSPKLTLNLGLRYEPAINPGEVNHRMEALVNTPLGINGRIVPGPYAFQTVPHAFARNPSLLNFDPRIGFAFDPYADHKTVIRGGFGIFHDVIEARSILPGYWLNPPYAIGAVSNPTYGPNPVVASSPISQAQGIAYQSSSTPTISQYNLNIQREILPNTIMTIGYVGSQGRHLFVMNDLNPPVNTGTAQNPILGTAPAHPCTSPGVPAGCNDAAIGHVRLQPTGVDAIPGNFLSNLSYLLNRYPGANSDYNSLQTSLTRRFSNNLQFQASYTYSKSMDINSLTYSLEGTGSSAQLQNNPYDSKQDWGRSTFDQTQIFEASGLYQLPFKRNFMVQGWQLSGIVSADTGTPYTVFEGFDVAGLSENAAAGERPNLVPGCSSNPKIGKVSEWYNPSCFSLPAPGTLGNLGRNTLIAPGFSDVDIALMKMTPVPKISEAFAVQFRVETFDTLNHPNFNFPAQPGQSVFTAQGGVNPAAGEIQSTAGNEVIGGAQRVIQFGLKILF